MSESSSNALLDCTASDTSDQAWQLPTGASEPAESALDLEVAYAAARKEAILMFERDYVRAMLTRTGGNVSEAARLAGIDRVYMHRLIRRHRAALGPTGRRVSIVAPKSPYYVINVPGSLRVP